MHFPPMTEAYLFLYSVITVETESYPAVVLEKQKEIHLRLSFPPVRNGMEQGRNLSRDHCFYKLLNDCKLLVNSFIR